MILLTISFYLFFSFYEALCPDSKGFIVNQLIPAFKRVPDLIEIEFFPYGKATTTTNSDGKEAEKMRQIR